VTEEEKEDYSKLASHTNSMHHSPSTTSFILIIISLSVKKVDRYSENNNKVVVEQIKGTAL
jgi:hypothetical protein